MPSATKPDMAQSKGQPPLQIRIYRPSDWEQLQSIFMAGVAAPLSVAVKHMYTWPSFFPVYPLVGGGAACLGRAVWSVANQLGLQAFRVEGPWSWMRDIGRGVVKNVWTWKETAALGSIGLGFITWGVIRWKVNQAFHGYAQMSLRSDLKDIPKHYRLEKVPRPKPSEQGECEEWEPKGASAFWVAEIGDELVGSIALDQRDAGPYGAAGELRRMTVSARFHRRGIASRLLEQLVDHAKRHGLKEIYLSTTQYQKAAIALYEKAGFKFVEDVPLMGPARVLTFRLDL